MNRATPSRVLLAFALGLSLAARAQSIAFVHEATILDAKEGPLKAPEGLACTDRNLVVGDTGNHRLVLFTVKEGRATVGEEVKLAQLTSPIRVQIDRRGDVLALDGKTHKVVRVAANGTFGGLVEPEGQGKGLVVVAFKVDARDNVYLLDVAARRVVIVDGAGTLAGELPLPKESVSVTDLAVDAAGTLYAVDAVGGAIWVAEKGAAGFRSLASNLKEKLNFATSISVSKGRLFLVDRHGNGIVVFGIDGSYMGRQLSVGWNNGLVNYPGELCLASDGTAYVADTLNNRVQVFSTGGK